MTAIEAELVSALAIDALTIGDDFRLDDDVDDLADLEGSIRTLGVLQPIVVRPAVDGWEVVAGRRRLAAARAAGLTEVPCVVRNLDDDGAADVALAENLHRRSLSPIEEGLAYAKLRDRGLTQQEIADRVGRSQAHVSRILRVLELPAELREKVHRREMSYVTALDRWGRRKYREENGLPSGTRTGQGHLSGADADAVSHWRRRHDRLLGGIHAVLSAHPSGDGEWRDLLNRVLKADRQPLDTPLDQARKGLQVFTGQGRPGGGRPR